MSASQSAPTAATSTPTPLWEQRFRACSVSVPAWALDAPDRSIYLSDASGVFEIYSWDRATNTHRQLTDRVAGTAQTEIEPSGSHVWWFNDTDGDEFGVWFRQPFVGGAAEAAIAGIEPAYDAGLELGRSVLALGTASEAGSRIFLWPYDGPPREVYRHVEDASVGALSADETLLAISHSEHGDSLHPAIRVIRVADGITVGDLSDGPGRGVEPVGFSPIADDHRLLVTHERHGCSELLLWDLDSGAVTELTLDVPGEFSAEWFPDGAALLVTADHHARSQIYRYDLSSGTLDPIETPRGAISSASARPAQVVEYHWSDAASPPTLRTTAHPAPLLQPPGPAAPPSIPLHDLWVDGSGGPIHALVSKKDSNIGPQATIFAIHGGPHHHDEDRFDHYRAAYLDHGYAVVEVNYRGSTGYGSQWRDAVIGAPGLTELADIAAVREHVVSSGVADPDRCILAGYSWGGYLTLLGLGTQPKLWSAGVAGVPVADYLAAYADEMEPLKAMDRVLFGGTPETNSDPWRVASPLTYVDNVRVPLLILAGANDPRCPLRQIENYVDELVRLNKPHEVYRFDAGHGSLVVEQQITMTAVELDFLRRRT